MRPGLEYTNSKAMMSSQMVGRSNSVPGTSSVLQRQLIGDTETDPDMFLTCVCVLHSCNVHCVLNESSLGFRRLC